MRFSFVVPVYNVSEYLDKCVQSLLAQDNDDYEIILVDDGSTDGKCPAMCDAYAEQYADKIRVIHQQNGGLGAARNTGLEAAKGEYLFFVDSDDYIADNALSILQRQIEISDADILTFRLQYVRENGIFPAEPCDLPKEQVLQLADWPQLLLMPPSAAIRVWRRSLFMDYEIRFPGRVWYEDLCTTPRCLAAAKRVVLIDAPLYFYLCREGSIMRNPNYRRNLEILQALDMVLTFFENQGCFAQYAQTLCYLTVDNVLMAAQRVLMINPDADILPQFLQYAKEHFPEYRVNPLLKQLGRKKLVVLWMLEHGHYRLLKRIFDLIHKVRSE